MTEAKNMIEIKNLNKYFGDVHVLKDINLTVKAGEKLVIIGPSGSGKSTLIRCVNYLEEPTSGTITIDGTELTKKNHLEMARKYSSMVFQQFNLYPNMTVLGNLTLAPIKLQKKSKEEATKTALEALRRVGLEAKAGEYPQNLSGGQQQRVAIGRALIMRPKLILADEPTGNLDSANSQDVIDLLTQASRRYQQTILMITHNTALTAAVDRVLRVKDGVVTDLGRKRNEKLS